METKGGGTVGESFGWGGGRPIEDYLKAGKGQKGLTDLHVTQRHDRLGEGLRVHTGQLVHIYNVNSEGRKAKETIRFLPIICGRGSF